MSELHSRHRLRIDPATDEPLFAAISRMIPGLGRGRARKAIMAGLVRIADTPCSDPNHILTERDVEVVCDFSQGIDKPYRRMRHGQNADAKPFTVLHRDDRLLVVDKATGVLSAPNRSGERGHLPELLRPWLREQGASADFIGVVHRIDRETSGCMVFALDREAQRLLGEQFASHAAERSYRCLVHGGPRRETDSLDGAIGRGRDGRRAVVHEGHPGKSAVTHFRVLERYVTASELAVRLETGRTHQIRVHLAGIGCPIIGDPVYVRGAVSDPISAPRMMLHARELALDHPGTGERLVITAPEPEAYRRCRDTLAKTVDQAR